MTRWIASRKQALWHNDWLKQNIIKRVTQLLLRERKLLESANEEMMNQSGTSLWQKYRRLNYLKIILFPKAIGCSTNWIGCKINNRGVIIFLKYCKFVSSARFGFTAELSTALNFKKTFDNHFNQVSRFDFKIQVIIDIILLLTYHYFHPTILNHLYPGIY